VLVSQGDPRRLDPLGTVAPGGQWSAGLSAWVEAVLGPAGAETLSVTSAPQSLAMARRWQQLEAAAQGALERQLGGAAVQAGTDESSGHALAIGIPIGRGGSSAADREDPEPSAESPARASADPAGSAGGPAGREAPDLWPGDGGDASGAGAHGPGDTDVSPGSVVSTLNEPWLARALSRLLPAGLPVMLASSSPVRDWESFAAAGAPWRPIHGFRGASGIDGTLSIACGLAEACGRLVLVSGDLALLHDANGWLWARQLRGRLTVVLIENGGGGIFEQLPIRTQPPERLDFERLFAMPQDVDQLALAALHGVPGRRLRRAADLPGDLAWALEQPFALLELRTCRRDDAALRQRLRLAVCAATSGSARRMAALDPARP